MEENAQHKSVPQKSPNYPNISLEEAITNVKALYDKDGKAGAPKGVALKYWGYNSESGPAVRTISALKKFGLTQDKQGRIVPTQRAIDLLVYPKNSERYAVALQEAALSPRIYKDLWEKYKDGFPSDEALKAELISEENFNPKQVNGFLSDFRKTLAYAGLAHAESGEPIPEGRMTMDQPGQSVNLRPNVPGAFQRLANSFPIPLRNQNQAVLTFNKLPVDEADLEVIKKWIELLKGNLTAAADQENL